MKNHFRLLATIILTLLSTVFTSGHVKIYVNTDLGGFSSVYKSDLTCEKDTPLNIQACEYFTDAVAAVIRGLRDGRATGVVVLDGHGFGAVIPQMMVTGAIYITGRPRPGAGNLSALDSSFAGMVCIGFHAMMGTPDGVLNHTQNSKSENLYWYNGVESGEMAQNALIAGYYGIPLIMVSGDEATCREGRNFFGNNIVTVTVKKGSPLEAATLYPFEETLKVLNEGAKRAAGIIRLSKPYKIHLSGSECNILKVIRIFPNQSWLQRKALPLMFCICSKSYKLVKSC